MGNITDQEKVEAYLKRELTEYEVMIFDDVVASVAKTISNYTSRNYGDPEEAEIETRTFDGMDSKELYVDDFYTINKVRLLDSYGNTINEFTEDTDWLLSPNNSPVNESIRLRNYHFRQGYGNVEIEGLWGSGEAPAGVVNVATALVARYFTNNSGGGDSGNIKKESIEGYSREFMTAGEIDSETQRIMSGLEYYRRILL